MAHYVFVSQKADSGYALTLEKGREEVAFVNRVYEAWQELRGGVATPTAIALRDLPLSLRKAGAESATPSPVKFRSECPHQAGSILQVLL